MPLTHISMRSGKSASYRAAIFDSLYQAMRETFDVPEDDFFMTISQHDAEDFRVSRNYMGISRSDDAILIQMTVSNTRPFAKKALLYRAIVDRLGTHPGLRPEDVFINLVEVLPENWSFGHGLAQYAQTQNR